MNKEKQKIYERDITNWVTYENNKNDDWKKHNLKLVRAKDLNKLKGFTTGFFIFLGLIAIAVTIFYLGYEDKLMSVVCEGTTCEGAGTLSCPACPSAPACPSCSNECNFPKKIKIEYVNGSG